MNIAHIILCIWVMESSSGKNLNHKDGSLGHLGVKKATLDYVNKRGHTNWKPAAMQNRDLAFQFADTYIRLYLEDHPETTEYDVFAMWRAGRTGMHHMTVQQQEYCHRGVRMMKALRRGDQDWRETR